MGKPSLTSNEGHPCDLNTCLNPYYIAVGLLTGATENKTVLVSLQERRKVIKGKRVNWIKSEAEGGGQIGPGGTKYDLLCRPRVLGALEPPTRQKGPVINTNTTPFSPLLLLSLVIYPHPDPSPPPTPTLPPGVVSLDNNR